MIHGITSLVREVVFYFSLPEKIPLKFSTKLLFLPVIIYAVSLDAYIQIFPYFIKTDHIALGAHIFPESSDLNIFGYFILGHLKFRMLGFQYLLGQK